MMLKVPRIFKIPLRGSLSLHPVLGNSSALKTRNLANHTPARFTSSLTAAQQPPNDQEEHHQAQQNDPAPTPTTRFVASIPLDSYASVAFEQKLLREHGWNTSWKTSEQRNEMQADQGGQSTTDYLAVLDKHLAILRLPLPVKPFLQPFPASPADVAEPWTGANNDGRWPLPYERSTAKFCRSLGLQLRRDRLQEMAFCRQRYVNHVRRAYDDAKGWERVADWEIDMLWNVQELQWQTEYLTRWTVNTLFYQLRCFKSPPGAQHPPGSHGERMEAIWLVMRHKMYRHTPERKLLQSAMDRSATAMRATARLSAKAKLAIMDVLKTEKSERRPGTHHYPPGSRGERMEAIWLAVYDDKLRPARTSGESLVRDSFFAMKKATGLSIWARRAIRQWISREKEVLMEMRNGRRLSSEAQRAIMEVLEAEGNEHSWTHIRKYMSKLSKGREERHLSVLFGKWWHSMGVVEADALVVEDAILDVLKAREDSETKRRILSSLAAAKNARIESASEASHEVAEEAVSTQGEQEPELAEEAVSTQGEQEPELAEDAVSTQGEQEPGLAEEAVSAEGKQAVSTEEEQAVSTQGEKEPGLAAPATS